MNDISETKKLANAIGTLALAMTEIMTERLRAVARDQEQRIEQKLVPLTIEPMLTKKQAAKHFQVASRTLDVWMKKGYLPYYKLGRNVRFKWSDVLGYWNEKFRVGRGWPKF